MFRELKKQLLEDPQHIVSLLETFDFCKMQVKSNEIRFARNEAGGLNIRIRLQNNENLTVVDFVNGVHTDIFAYIVSECGATLREVLQETKKILGLEQDWQPKKKKMLFGGIYENIGKPYSNISPKIYPEEILKQYERCGNLRFLKDHISLESQTKFEIMYNIETQRIVIPIRDIYGNLVGTKCRRNYDTDNPDDPKYLFELSCAKNLILYGAYQNYQYLMNADKILIGEAEKFTCACDSYGYNNAVSIMGNTLSSEQARQLLAFNAKEYCFMLDEGLDLNITFQNAKLLKEYAAMREIKISYFDWTQSLSLSSKESPADEGKEVLKRY